MLEASMAKRASCTPYFKSVTWSLRSKLENPGTDFANSVSSVTVSTDVHWQQWKIRTSTSLSFSDPAEPTIFATRVCSASWRVSMSWMTKGCRECEREWHLLNSLRCTRWIKTRFHYKHNSVFCDVDLNEWTFYTKMEKVDSSNRHELHEKLGAVYAYHTQKWGKAQSPYWQHLHKDTEPRWKILATSLSTTSAHYWWAAAPAAVQAIRALSHGSCAKCGPERKSMC